MPHHNLTVPGSLSSNTHPTSSLSWKPTSYLMIDYLMQVISQILIDLFFLLILLWLGKFKVVCLGGCFFNNKDNCNLVLCDNLQGLATVLESLSCVQLCDPMDGSPRGSSVHGISQARILVWVAIFFSRESSQSRDRTHVSYIAGGFFTTEPPGVPKVK